MLAAQSRRSILQRLVLVRTGQVMSPGDSWALLPFPSLMGMAEEEVVPLRIPGRGWAPPEATSEGIPRQRGDVQGTEGHQKVSPPPPHRQWPSRSPGLPSSTPAISVQTSLKGAPCFLATVTLGE